MKTNIAAKYARSLDTFKGMPGVSLAKLMREVGHGEIRKRWGKFIKEEHLAPIERDCRIISRLNFGRFAWLVGIGGSYMVEVHHYNWGRDAFGNSLAVETNPPVCLGKDRELGLQFLIHIAGSNLCQTHRFFFIDTWEKKERRIREMTGYELAGHAMVYNDWKTYGLDGKQEISRDMWHRMQPDRASSAHN
jgi:hypothetical protein